MGKKPQLDYSEDIRRFQAELTAFLAKHGVDIDQYYEDSFFRHRANGWELPVGQCIETSSSAGESWVIDCTSAVGSPELTVEGGDGEAVDNEQSELSEGPDTGGGVV